MKKTTLIQIRTTKEEKEKIRKYAKLEGFDYISPYVLHLIRNRIYEIKDRQ